MATPALAGCVLIRQYYMDGFYPVTPRTPATPFTPTGTLVKATMINATVDMTGVAGYPSSL